ncbi:MFS transporter [Polynucleobacter sp. SHI8]|jgi:MFS family permease|uniref:MFS transporter n=1 Tax=unclassified Polynucleobacter TaxID=2640945 RepID=UPI002493310A|nr:MULTISPECIES: MFS transporter [unclassified Polynucleobacter]BDW10272.1 MFS transporter [Polynucleobacter sp. SHI2]BDW12718.1 MFS transporter [Polynucleobacter sp. SHI8]
MSSTKAPAFAAFKFVGFRFHVITYMLAMMADSVEHVISYWMLYQKFHSPELAGFAVLSHWLPFLFFSVPAGALADKYDPRRLIQAGIALFMICSLSWAYLFITDTVEQWHAMILLVLHGFAGVLWHTISQILLYDIVDASVLPSAVRILASARYLGLLIGPAVGAGLMLTVGPKYGLIVNAFLYLPTILWLATAPYGPAFRVGEAPVKRAVKGFQDIVQTIRDISGKSVIVSMILLAGTASFFVGNGYQAQMPGFAQDLGHGDPGLLYSLLLGADAAGALIAGIVLESRGFLKPHPRTALILAICWCVILLTFALNQSYYFAIALLLVCGFFELAFNSMAQSIVQINAPTEIRGRVIGLYNMAALGMRAGSGITVGLVGGMIGIHASLAIAAATLLFIISFILMRYGRSL